MSSHITHILICMVAAALISHLCALCVKLGGGPPLLQGITYYFQFGAWALPMMPVHPRELGKYLGLSPSLHGGPALSLFAVVGILMSLASIQLIRLSCSETRTTCAIRSLQNAAINRHIDMLSACGLTYLALGLKLDVISLLFGAFSGLWIGYFIRCLRCALSSAPQSVLLIAILFCVPPTTWREIALCILLAVRECLWMWIVYRRCGISTLHGCAET